MKITIDIPDHIYKTVIETGKFLPYRFNTARAIKNGVPLPECHGRLGDLDELEQRISNFVEHDAHMTDEYTLVRQRSIVDGIRQTPTIIEAEGAKE